LLFAAQRRGRQSLYEVGRFWSGVEALVETHLLHPLLQRTMTHAILLVMSIDGRRAFPTYQTLQLARRPARQMPGACQIFWSFASNGEIQEAPLSHLRIDSLEYTCPSRPAISAGHHLENEEGGSK
jgi:hypothetical protein